jgi:BRCA1-associated protein
VHSFKDCPICLETFEEDPRIITILCSHKFHYKCLSDWRDQTCPVCRYQQYPFELTFCESCDIHQDLWCCIICGFIGCGGVIPVSGHIRDHSNETSHIYAKPIIKELKSSRPKGIFDHSTNDFIHSISYSPAMGTIVASEPSSYKKDKKPKDVYEEINQLISSTLDSQRQHYQKELAKIDEEMGRIQQDSADTCNYMQADLDSLKLDLDHMKSLILDSQESLANLTKSMNILNEKLANIKKENQKMKKLKKQKEEEIENLRQAKRDELALIKKQISDTLVEIKDMKVHIDNKKKIEILPVQKGSSIMLLETGPKKSKK